MSKVFAFLLILLLQFTILPLQAFASADCSSNDAGNITYAPTAFSPPSGSNLTLTFTINNDNAYNNFLKGKTVRLHYIVPGAPGIGDYNTPEVTIPMDSKTFQIPLTGDSKMTNPGEHQAVLDLKVGNNRHDEYCQGIKYFVSNPDACVIDPTLNTKPPKRIPPSYPLTIAFSGKATTEYTLLSSKTPNLDAHADDRGKVTTDRNQQGVFSDIIMDGKSGDTIYLDITTHGRRRNSACSTQIVLDITAPTPGPRPSSVPTPGPGAGVVPPGTLVTTPTGAKVCNPGDLSCTSGGGTPCDGIKGVSTAIGCIHTNPAALVKDVLTFAVGIGGGLAFLMMLLGAFQMVTSAGNPETLQAGKDRFTSAIIGLLFVIFSVLLLQIIGVGILAIPGFTK